MVGRLWLAHGAFAWRMPRPLLGHPKGAHIRTRPPGCAGLCVGSQLGHSPTCTRVLPVSISTNRLVKLRDIFGGYPNRKRETARQRRRDVCGGGSSDLSPSDVAPIFERVTGIPQARFAEVRPGWWVRPSDHGMHTVLQFLRNSRGYDYRFCWGVSLSWVPRVARGKLRWHRTPKSAVFDLWDQAYDFLIHRTTPWKDADRYFPDRSLGATCFEEDLTTCWELMRPAVHDWWTQAATPEGVLARAEEQSARNWEGAYHTPDPHLVAAFTVAHLGRLDEARDRLAKATEFRENEALLTGALNALVPADPRHRE